jgi:hypothetical protein
MTIAAAKPSPAAASPKHPEHARWVKDQTLKIEVDHARAMGGTYRDAEVANERSLARLAGRRRDRARPDPVPRKAPPSAAERQAKRAAEGVTFQPVAPVTLIPAPKCKACGRCIRCRREERTKLILQKGREGDPAMQWLALNFVAILFGLQKRTDTKIAPTRRSRGREVPFSRMRHQQRINAFLDAAAAICDWSARMLGSWR